MLSFLKEIGKKKTKMIELFFLSLLFVFVPLQGIFIKDSNSLAYYNVTPTSIVQLQLKERGGRKK